MSELYAVIDSDGDLRFVFHTIEMALRKKRELKWGKIFKIKWAIVSKELI